MNYNKKYLKVILFVLSLYSIGLSAAPKYWFYTLADHDTLWGITFKYSHIRYWQGLQKLNNITNPRKIPTGTKIKIPLAWLNLKNVQVNVVAIQGQPIMKVNDKIAVLRKGDSLKKGDMLITQEKENVLLEFVDNSKVLVKENTEIKVNQLLAYSTTGIADSRITLNKGSIDNFVNPRKSKEGTYYEVTTPSAVLAARGTQYRISISADQETSRSEVLKGVVNAKGSGTELSIPDGMGTVIKQGEPPSPPTKLLVAPDLSTMPTLVKSVPMQLNFTALERAVSYQIEISPDNKFIELAYSGTSEWPIVDGVNLADGHYYIRVRGTDSLGLQGYNAIHNFEVNTQPSLIPILSTPIANSVVRGSSILFRWSEVQGISHYHLQLAIDSNFTTIFFQQKDTTKTELNIYNLEAGDYFWRVASMDTLNNRRFFSDTVKFTLKFKPRTIIPKTDLQIMKESELMLRWKKKR